jgi:translation initiation factor IF-1
MIRWLTGVLTVAAALADPGAVRAATDDTLAPVLACAAEQDSEARLACFDAAVARLRNPAPVATAAASTAATAAAVVPPPAPAANPAANLTPEEKFGLRGELKQQKLGELTELSATATEVAAKPHGELVVTLDNGQVWAEISPGSKIRLKPGDTVKIEAGALGSFILLAPNGRSSKVSRVR